MSSSRLLLRLYAQGKGKKQISTLTGIARNTVKKYLLRFSAIKLTYADINELSDQELDQRFTPLTPVVKDERYEQLQQRLPQIEKGLKRKGATRLQLGQAFHPDHFAVAGEKVIGCHWRKDCSRCLSGPAGTPGTTN